MPPPLFPALSAPSYAMCVVCLCGGAGSGRLDFATFHRLVVEQSPHLKPAPSTEQEVLEHFKVFDLKRDGHITVQDLVYLLRELGEPLTAEDVHHLLREIEIDGDQRVPLQPLVAHLFRTSVL